MIVQFVHGMDLEAFRKDPKTVAAVERKLLLISEAASQRMRSVCALACRGTISAAWATGSGIAMTGWMSRRCETTVIDESSAPQVWCLARADAAFGKSLEVG